MTQHIYTAQSVAQFIVEAMQDQYTEKWVRDKIEELASVVEGAAIGIEMDADADDDGRPLTKDERQRIEFYVELGDQLNAAEFLLK